MTDIFKGIRERLRRYRGDRSQAEVARMAGVSLPAYKSWETGTTPRIDGLIKVADVLDVKAAELVFGPSFASNIIPAAIMKEIISDLEGLYQEDQKSFLGIYGDIKQLRLALRMR